ncbi:YraN family protein [Butyrivibrio sp. CB08]|uniref:YraN family protein n=1 Tax=Butyrivibrio sp. CB08 TaxID=2364879 RepID=UPI001FAA27FA|nr:YraN family protein [Butyrivibrio sp. CB08]
MNKRVIGNTNEDLACNYLKEHGCRILERNFRCKLGEIDIIARDGPYLCFIEVKYRKDNSFGAPQEAVNYSKRRRISSVSRFYLYSKKISFDSPIRYDVIAVCASEGMLTFEWIKNAFDYCN